jgi:hypothetical protein
MFKKLFILLFNKAPRNGYSYTTYGNNDYEREKHGKNPVNVISVIPSEVPTNIQA